MTPTTSQKTPRRKQLAAIHAAKRDLALDEATYRSVLWTLARVKSAADLDAHGRAAVLDHFKSRGWRALGKGRGGRVRLPAERRSLRAKIDLMLGDRPAAYADALAQKICGVERLDWCTPAQLQKIVAALWYDAQRHPKAGHD
jgi:phage gp16-like protein